MPLTDAQTRVEPVASTSALAAGTPTSSVRKTRTRNGCLTCRGRKKRCTEEKPVCGGCSKLKLVCKWPEPKAKDDRPNKGKMVSGQGKVGKAAWKSAINQALTGQEPDWDACSRSGSMSLNASLPSIPPYLSFLSLDSSAVDMPNTTSDSALHAHDAATRLEAQLPWAPFFDSISSLGPQVDMSTYHPPWQLPPEASSSHAAPEMTLVPSGFRATDAAATNMLSDLGLDTIDFDEILQRPLWPDSGSSNGLWRSTSPFYDQSAIVRFANSTESSTNTMPRETVAKCALLASSDFAFTQAYLLSHYSNTLAQSVSISPSESTSPSQRVRPSSTSSPNLFLSLLPHARRLPYLMYSILSWSAANLCAKGPGNEAMGTLADELGTVGALDLGKALDQAEADAAEGRTVEWEPILAGSLMLVQSAICRGDVAMWRGRLQQAAQMIQKSGGVPSLSRSSLSKMLLRNFLYHDILSSSASKDGLLLDYSILRPPRGAPRGSNDLATPETMISERIEDEGERDEEEEELDTLMGLAEPVFLLIGQITGLEAKKRELARTRGGLIDEEDLLVFLADVERIELQLDEEKEQLAVFLLSRPELDAHRYFHEVFSLAARLYLKMICDMAPISLPIIMLVRKMLNLIETISVQNLPGHCSMHWAYYMVQLNAAPITSPSHPTETDRDRAGNLFRQFQKTFAFLNTNRSRTLVEEAWRTNDEGRRFIDPTDILEKWGWHLNWA